MIKTVEQICGRRNTGKCILDRENRLGEDTGKKVWHVFREQRRVQSGQGRGHNRKPLMLRLNKQIQSARDHRFLAGMELIPTVTVGTGKVAIGH